MTEMALHSESQGFLVRHLMVAAVQYEGFQISWNRTSQIYTSHLENPEAFFPVDTPDEIALGFQKGMEMGFRTLIAPPETWTHASWHAVHAAICPLDKHPGAYRVTGNMYYSEDVSPPLSAEVPYLMEVFRAWLRHYTMHGMDKFVLAVNAYLFFDHIHPYDDCNGRTSRVVMVFLMLHFDIFPPVFQLDHDNEVIIEAQDLAFKGYVNPFIAAVVMACQSSRQSFDQFVTAR
jgi:Fic family protein